LAAGRLVLPTKILTAGNVNFKILMFFHVLTVESAYKQPVNKDLTGEFPSSRKLPQN